MSARRATAFAPATIGNVGPGFDVLGLAVDGLGDRVTVELTDGPSAIVDVSGRDAALIPRDPARNAAAVAALAMLARLGVAGGVRLWIEKGLPVAGGLGGSAASAVAGALAARVAHEGGLASQGPALLPAAPIANPSTTALPMPPPGIPLPGARGGELAGGGVVEAALVGEAAVAGRHLDNIAPCVLGGLVLVRSVDPIDLVPVPVQADWWVALVTPQVRVETRAARALLPESWERSGWIQQMANTTALAWAFASGDADLVRRALDDRYAEPRRATLIPHFADVKRAALDAGALGCSISGSGPTVFALAADRALAERCGHAMQAAFADIRSTVHVGRVRGEGARGEVD